MRVAIGKEPIKIDIQTGKFDKGNAKEVAELGDDISSAFGNAASAINTINSALGSMEDPAANAAARIASAIAMIAQSFAKSLMGTSSPWEWIPAAIAGTATMISTISSIKSATSKHYAEGGIVPGNDYTDNTPIMVSSGELILNKSQQDVVAKHLQENEGQSNASHSEVMISSENMRITLRNGASRRGMNILEYLSI